MRNLTIVAISIWGSFALAEPVTTSFDAKGVKFINLENQNGSVTVEGKETGTIKVTVDKKKFPENCRFKMKTSEMSLTISVTLESWIKDDNCIVDFQLVVPKNVALDFRTGSGHLEINGDLEKINFKSGTGNVTLTGAVRKLDGATGTGNVTLNGPVHEGILRSGSGNFDVSYRHLPTKGRLKLVTGSGNTKIQVPKGSKVASELETGYGNIENDVGNTPGATYKISAKAGAGNLSLKNF